MFSHHMYRPLCLSALAATLLLAPAHSAEAQDKWNKNTKHTGEQVLRQSALLDVQKNTVSNVEFYTTNYGIFGLNVPNNAGGLFWPRGSKNQYGFCGGVWFGAKKQVDGEERKMVLLTINPNSGNSWVVPGRIADGYNMLATEAAKQNYGVYFSTDYNDDGTIADGSNQANWPIWCTLPEEAPGTNGCAGYLVPDPGQRSLAVYPKGPSMLSDEDIVSMYKDTDLKYYDMGEEKAAQRGYPLRTEIVQTMYTWGTGDMKDVVLMQYDIVNRSQETLRDCWFAPAMDFDIGAVPNTQAAASNDRVRYYHEDPLLDMAVQWTDHNMGEAGKKFGYVGMSFAVSPAISPQGFLRGDQLKYERSDQLGLVTFRNWTMENDPFDDGSRYDFISSAALNGDNGPGDKRFLMATGPFHLLPGQTVKVVVALLFAPGSKGGDADGSTEDMAGLAELARKARLKYEEDFPAGVVGVREQAASEGVLSVHSVYPNPASALSHMEFTLGTAADAAVDIVDITGRVVLSHRRQLPAGTHVADIRAGDLQPGVYTCRVSANGVVQSTLFTVVR